MENGIAVAYDGWDEWERKAKQLYAFDFMGSKFLLVLRDLIEFRKSLMVGFRYLKITTG